MVSFKNYLDELLAFARHKNDDSCLCWCGSETVKFGSFSKNDEYQAGKYEAAVWKDA